MLQLSEKELETLKLAVTGVTNKAIAQKNFVSLSTVKANLSSIMRKPKVSNRTELAYVVLKNKIIDI